MSVIVMFQQSHHVGTEWTTFGVAFAYELRVPMLHFLSWIGIAVIVVVIAVNAAFMFISPRAWFRLPEWFPGRGSMTEHKYGSGWGAVETRIAGGMMLAAILWVLYDALLRPR
jgi:hypothetical protein